MRLTDRINNRVKIAACILLLLGEQIAVISLWRLMNALLTNIGMVIIVD